MVLLSTNYNTELNEMRKKAPHSEFKDIIMNQEKPKCWHKVYFYLQNSKCLSTSESLVYSAKPYALQSSLSLSSCRRKSY